MKHSNSLDASPQELATIAATLDPFNKDVFLEQLYLVIQDAISELEKTADKYFSADEDTLTNFIAVYLNAKGYDASEQTKNNGSVDLSVFDKNARFKWIAEAKRGNSYHGVFEGKLQLFSRYLTRDENAGFLIYYQKTQAMRFFAKWYEYMNTGGYYSYREIKDFTQEVDGYFIKNLKAPVLSDKTNYFDYIGRTKHGNQVSVRNFVVNVFFKPIDKSGRDNQTILEGQAKIKVVEACEAWLHDGCLPDDIAEFLGKLKVIHPEYFE